MSTVGVFWSRNLCLSVIMLLCTKFRVNQTTRSSADADNGLDAFVGQSRSTSILGPFQVKVIKNNSE